MPEETCGTCKCHLNVDGEWICLHRESDNYGLRVGNSDGKDCIYWEEKKR